MQEVSVIIPNFNGMAYLDGVLAGLECQTVSNFDVILVDNGSNDGSCAFVAARYPWVHLIELPENFGFCKAVNEGISFMTGTGWMMQETITALLDGLMREVRGKISIPMKRKRRFLLPAQELLFTERRSLMNWDILTKNILHIWRTWTWDTGPGSTDMKTGTHLMPWYTMWEAVPADPDIISSRSGILPEIIFI